MYLVLAIAFSRESDDMGSKEPFRKTDLAIGAILE